MNVVSIILSIVSMICAGLSIGFTLSARNDEKKLEELRREQERAKRASQYIIAQEIERISREGN